MQVEATDKEEEREARRALVFYVLSQDLETNILVQLILMLHLLYQWEYIILMDFFRQICAEQKNQGNGLIMARFDIVLWIKYALQ